MLSLNTVRLGIDNLEQHLLLLNLIGIHALMILKESLNFKCSAFAVEIITIIAYYHSIQNHFYKVQFIKKL